jgi:Flp pilus assembly pilin Flp
MPAEKGGTLIEYSLLLALISLVTVASIYQVQEQITLTFWRVSDATQGSPDPGTPDGNPGYLGDTAGRPAGTEGSAP